MGVSKRPTKKSPTARKPGRAAEEAAPVTGKPKLSTAGSAASARERPTRGTELSTKIGSSLGVVAAMVLAVLLNVLVVRHYTRWDFTTGGQFTLSDPTIETLQSLDEPIRVIVLMSKDDPLGMSVHQILETYQTKTSRMTIQSIDPDRDQAERIAVQQKYGVLAGDRGGKVVTDAAMIVVRGDRHHYVMADEFVAVDDADDMRARPRLEQAITSAIRSVQASERPRACFTTGHGEPNIDEGGDFGLAELKEKLAKNNYEVVSVFGVPTSATPTPAKPLEGCRLLVLAAPTEPVPRDHVATMKSFIEGGGNALLVASPVPAIIEGDFINLGVDELLALAGVAPQRDFVFEKDPARRGKGGHGETFFPDVLPHAATAALVKERERGLGVVVVGGSSLRDLETSIKPEPLLMTSDQSFGMVDFSAWAQDVSNEPRLTEKDHKGPLVLAVAAERPKLAPTDARGARIIVVGALNPLAGGNWRRPEYRGNAMFVEGAITWLSSHQQFLDIPDKPTVPVGLRLTEDALTWIFRGTVIFIPGVLAIIGIVVLQIRRRRAPIKKLRKSAVESSSESDSDDASAKAEEKDGG